MSATLGLIATLLALGAIACTLVLTILPFETKEYQKQLIKLYLPTNSVIEYDFMKEHNIDAHLADINIECHIPPFDVKDNYIKVATSDDKSKSVVPKKPNNLTFYSNPLLRYWTHDYPPKGTITIKNEILMVWSWGTLSSPPDINCNFHEHETSKAVAANDMLDDSKTGLIVMQFCNFDPNRDHEFIELEITEEEPNIDNMDTSTIICNDPTNTKHSERIYQNTKLFFSTKNMPNDDSETIIKVEVLPKKHEDLWQIMTTVVGILCTLLLYFISLGLLWKNPC